MDYTCLELRQPRVAVQNSVIVGFIELELDGHIDCLYVHPEHQRQGVAGALVRQLVRDARRLGIAQLHAEASKLARPVFATQGFALQAQNSVHLWAQTLIN